MKIVANLELSINISKKNTRVQGEGYWARTNGRRSDFALHSSGRYGHVFYCFWTPEPNQMAEAVREAIQKTISKWALCWAKPLYSYLNILAKKSNLCFILYYYKVFSLIQHNPLINICQLQMPYISIYYTEKYCYKVIVLILGRWCRRSLLKLSLHLNQWTHTPPP